MRFLKLPAGRAARTLVGRTELNLETAVLPALERLRKMVAKNVGLLLYNLPASSDPRGQLEL